VSRDSAFARALVELLAARVMLALGDLDASTVPAMKRVAAYLGSLARRDSSGRWHAMLPVSKTVLAARLGMKKETLSRTLRTLVDEGLIDFSGRNFTLKDPKRLAAINPAASG
jgi:CRP-like cAMP-binding protein